jgi:hypothetical protein
VADIHELSPREDDWVFWPRPGVAVDTGGKCNCGHEGLGPDWHVSNCPALVFLWRNRARELHDRLWDMWEHVRSGKPIDATGEKPAIWTGE